VDVIWKISAVLHRSIDIYTVVSTCFRLGLNFYLLLPIIFKLKIPLALMHIEGSERLQIITEKTNKKCQTGNKTVISSIKKRRFWIETARTENIDSFRKSKLRMHDSNIDQAILMTIISKQNTQIELLFDMIRNIPGNKDFLKRNSFLKWHAHMN